MLESLMHGIKVSTTHLYVLQTYSNIEFDGIVSLEWHA